MFSNRPTRSSFLIPTGVRAIPVIEYSRCIAHSTGNGRSCSRLTSHGSVCRATSGQYRNKTDLQPLVERSAWDRKETCGCLGKLSVRLALTRRSQRCLPTHISWHHRRKHIRASSQEIISNENNVSKAPRSSKSDSRTHAFSRCESYDDAVESRLFEGHEARGVTGDLWGVINLFTYSPEGTSLQRVSLSSNTRSCIRKAQPIIALQAAKLASEEAQLADNLRDIISDKLTTLKIETSYEEENDQLLQGTEKGTEV